MWILCTIYKYLKALTDEILQNTNCELESIVNKMLYGYKKCMDSTSLKPLEHAPISLNDS